MKYLLFIIVLLPLCGFGQSTGLYGKKTIVEVQVAGSYPLFNNDDNTYKADGTNLVDSRILFDYGFRGNVMHAFNNQIGLGIELGIDRQLLTAPESVLLESTDFFGMLTSTFSIQHERLRMQTLTIMPKFEFSSMDNLLPMGLSHELGIGYTRSSILERDYQFNLTTFPNDTILSPIENGVVDYNTFQTGFTVMYQINMRTPITESFMISYGLRYQANFVRQQRPFATTQIGFFDLRDEIRTRRNRSLLMLHIGAAMAF